MRQMRFLSVIPLLLSVLIACGEDDTDSSGSADGPVRVLATTSIIGQLAEEVGGDRVEVEVLIDRGVDPHLYEPSPSDVVAASEADLVLMNGLELDDHLIDDIESANSDVNVTVITEGIDLIESGAGHDEHEGDDHEEDDHEHEDEHDEHEDEDEGHDHGDYDPHVWQDPLRVKVMVDNIQLVLADMAPGAADEFEQNSGEYKELLDELHAQIQEMIDEIPEDQRQIVTNHEAFGYFADRYGLEIVGTVIPGTSTEADPSAQDVAELTEIIEDSGVRAIFAEELVNPDIAEQIANDTGVEIVTGLYTDQLGEEGSEGETLEGMLLSNAKLISEALR